METIKIPASVASVLKIDIESKKMKTPTKEELANNPELKEKWEKEKIKRKKAKRSMTDFDNAVVVVWDGKPQISSHIREAVKKVLKKRNIEDFKTSHFTANNLDMF